MKKTALLLSLVLILCLGAVLPAQAAEKFAFTQGTVSVFEGDTYETKLVREGSFKDGDVTYSSSNKGAATVTKDGKIKAISKGVTVVKATLTRNGKFVRSTQMRVQVLRPVTKVTLNTTKLSVYKADDPAVADLLAKETKRRVIVIPAGRSVTLSATCTPSDASSKRVAFSSSDEGVAHVAGTVLKAVQSGECTLVVKSVQNPSVQEKFQVLVIQPAKKIQVTAKKNKVPVGSTLKLKAVVSPEDTTIKDVTWTSRNPAIATVDENGVVTGKKRGSVTITATAADGSNVTGSIYLSVTQPVKSITFTQSSLEAIVGRRTQAKITIQPADATDRTVTWSSSDESIATVTAGQVTGVKAGECTIIVRSNSDPDVTAEIPVKVSQLVTKIECTNSEADLRLKTGESVELTWKVSPKDATNKGLTFRSLAPKVATVDENGVVRAVGRGVATIVATAKDIGRKQCSIRVNVIQPVTGVEMVRQLYYVQLGWSTTVRAQVLPRNANNQRVQWSSVNERIATVRSNGTSTGSVYGASEGTTIITAFTEDGGYTATTQVKVGHFNDAVMIEEFYLDANDNIRLSLRNMTRDLTLGNVHFKIEVFDIAGNPLICSPDGTSSVFEGDYQYLLAPLSRTYRTGFRYREHIIDRQIGMMQLTVTSWRDADGYTWTIPESERVSSQWTRSNYNPK